MIQRTRKISKTNKSMEDYLERILMLQEQGNQYVHAIDIANSMHFTKASVSIALKKLENDGFVLIDNTQALFLSPSGMDVAKKIYERHKIIGAMLIKLGVPKDIAYEDACKIEHDISDITFEKMKNHYLEEK